MRLVFALCTLALVSCGNPSHSRLESQSPENSYSQTDFPLGPDASATPGSLCSQPDEYRYPERIAYCNRSVSKSLKATIISQYDHEFDYKIKQMPRTQFKIDHFIPLCMGGSNHSSNLWPQHESVYKITDPLEERFCTLLSRAKLKQKQAIEQIKYAKLHLSEVPGIVSHLDDLLGK